MQHAGLIHEWVEGFIRKGEDLLGVQAAANVRYVLTEMGASPTLQPTCGVRHLYAFFPRGLNDPRCHNGILTPISDVFTGGVALGVEDRGCAYWSLGS